MAKASKAKSGKAKKSGAKTKSSGGGKSEILIVASKMKEAIRKAGYNVAGDAIHHLNERVHEMLKGATNRAGTNGRKTVRGHDF